MLTSNFECRTYFSNHSNTSLPSCFLPVDLLIANSICIRGTDPLELVVQKGKVNAMNNHIRTKLQYQQEIRYIMTAFLCNEMRSSPIEPRREKEKDMKDIFLVRQEIELGRQEYGLLGK
jgi:hypothetical protein